MPRAVFLGGSTPRGDLAGVVGRVVVRLCCFVGVCVGPVGDDGEGVSLIGGAVGLGGIPVLEVEGGFCEVFLGGWLVFFL